MSRLDDLWKNPRRFVLWLLAGIALSGCAPREAEEPVIPPTEKSEAVVRVRVFPAVSEIIDDRVELTGVAAPARKATVAAEVPGRIVKRGVELGQQIKKRDILYRIDEKNIRLDLDQATVSRRARTTDVGFSQSELKRAEELIASRAAAGQVLDQARYNLDRARDGLALAKATEARTRKALRDTSVRAPFSGRVERYFVEVGDYVSPGIPLVRIVDISEIRLTVGVTASTAARIERGKTFQVSFESAGGLTRDAVVASIAPSLNPETGTYPVELLVDNADGQLLGGMVGRVGFGFDGKSQVNVPRKAVVRIGGIPHLFVVSERDGADVAVLRPVRLGAMAGGRIEVLEGIAVGDLVVVQGQFALRDGDRVRVENRGPADGGT